MADDLDIEAMLEASYETKNCELNKETNCKNSTKVYNSPRKEKLKDSLNHLKSLSEKRNHNNQTNKEEEKKSHHKSRSREANRSLKKTSRRSRSRNSKPKTSYGKDKYDKCDVSRKLTSKDKHRMKSEDKSRYEHRSDNKSKYSRKSPYKPSKSSDSRDRNSRRSKRSSSRDRRVSSSNKHRRNSSSNRRTRKSRSRSKEVTKETYRLSPPIELSAEEKDARTVFVWQLSSKIRTIDLEKFFSAIGKINDVRLILDNKTRKSKGIAYVEFKNPESVSLALALTGTRLLGIPVQVQPSQAEKNRAAQNIMRSIELTNKGPMRLHVESLHHNISEEMLYKIFEPFGKIDIIKMKKNTNGLSQNSAFITYRNAEEARRALEHMNNFEIAGKAIKVSHVSNTSDEVEGERSIMSSDNSIVLTKLTEWPNTNIGQNQSAFNVPHVSTQCFVLSNMFDSTEQNDDSFFDEIHDEIIEECNQHGGVLHIYIDRNDPKGCVYIKCPSIITASQCVSLLHGKSFSGRLITASYVPLNYYHQLFSQSITAKTLLKTKES